MNLLKYKLFNPYFQAWVSKGVLFIVFGFLIRFSLMSQDRTIDRIEIISRITYDYREDDLMGYRMDLDSTCLKYDQKSRCFQTDTFYNYDKIVFKDENFEDYVYSDNIHVYRSNSGISLEEIKHLLFELDIENYRMINGSDTIIFNDSVNIIHPFSILIPDDFDFSYLEFDSSFFVRLLKLNFPDVSYVKDEGEMIDEFLESWISSNALFHYVSYEHSIIVRIYFTHYDKIELNHSHPGNNNCKWMLSIEGRKYYLFNPFLNNLMFKAMDTRFGNSKYRLLDYKSIETIIGGN